MSEDVALVTGATGFLGGHLVPQLARSGWRVIAQGRDRDRLAALETPSVRPLRCGLDELPAAAEALAQDGPTPQVVVHAAARSTFWGAWPDFYRDNVLGTAKVLACCRRLGVRRLVLVSSPSVYTAPRDRLAIKEDEVDWGNRLNGYIRSKLMAERLVRQAAPPGLEVVVLRPRGLFGVGDTSIIPRLLATNETGGVPLFRGGSVVADVTCVENVAHAIGLALTSERAPGRTYNITNGEPRAFGALLAQLLRALGRRPRWRPLPVRAAYLLAAVLEAGHRAFAPSVEPRLTRYLVCTLGYSQTLDIDAARADLGYQPTTSLDEGIERYAASAK